MSLGKRPFYSYRPKSKDSSNSTKTEGETVIVDITRAVRRFVDVVDSQIGPGYDVRGVVLEYSAYLECVGDNTDPSALAHRLMVMGYARRLSEANLIAKQAMKQLYVDMTQEIKDQGYIAGTVISVDFKNARGTNSIHCQVLLSVV